MEELFDGYVCTSKYGCVFDVDYCSQRFCCECPFCVAVEDLEEVKK